MLREHQKIKNLLQSASEIKTNGNVELGDFSAVCHDGHEKILHLLTLNSEDRINLEQCTKDIEHLRTRPPASRVPFRT
jgi:hypothetical protein